MILPHEPGKTDAQLQMFRHKKTIPKVIEKEVLCALSFYPELQDTAIHFVFKQKIRGSVMLAQPKFGTLFNKKREYNILISSLFRLTHAVMPIHQIPADIMIGWIGHELGHIMDYENRGLAGMARFGLGYLLSEKYVRKAERVADTFAVRAGMGRYILKTKHFILDHAALPDRYKKKIARLYLSPDDIVEQVKKLESERKMPS
jgi:hypothetical protein